MKEYVIKLDIDQLRTIGAALGEIPHKFAAPLVEKINKQIAEQEVENVEAS